MSETNVDAFTNVQEDSYRERVALLNSLVNDLEFVARWMHDPDVSSLEEYEAIAAWFHSETGYLRPGKSYPIDCIVPEDQKEVWDKWCIEKRREAIAKVRNAAKTLRENLL